MIYVRGDRRNYDQWSKNGCVGWSAEEVLPYFKKSSELGVTDLKKATDLDTHATLESFEKSAKEAGLASNLNYNSFDSDQAQDGCSSCQVTVTDGVRQDTATAFLYQTGNFKRRNLTIISSMNVHVPAGAFKRRNLTIISHAQVIKVITQGKP